MKIHSTLALLSLVTLSACASNRGAYAPASYAYRAPSGSYATVTATLAGQAVMEGFLRLRLAPWLRRLMTRSLAILPAAGVTLIYGAAGTGRLLILTQVVLSLQLSFAVIPLVFFTTSRGRMGALVAPLWLGALAWAVAAAIVALNLKLLWDFFGA